MEETTAMVLAMCMNGEKDPITGKFVKCSFVGELPSLRHPCPVCGATDKHAPVVMVPRPQPKANGGDRAA